MNQRHNHPNLQSLPNILVLMTDQQRWDSLGVYGCDFAHTPNLDRLGREGAVFDNCYVNNPICTPSRASMLTGKHLPGHGVYRLYDVLPEGEVLFPERLQQLGYTTALFGKLHVSAVDYEHYQRHPHDGFDVFEPCMEGCLRMDSPNQAYAQWLRENHPEFHDRLAENMRNELHHPQDVHMTRWAAERTIDFLQRQDGGQPFFCMMSIFDPHNPYEDFPEEMKELLDPNKIPEPVPVEDGMAGKPEAVQREHHNSYMGDFSNYTKDDVRAMRFGYHASLAFADQEFGRVLDALEAQGLDDNTLVIFTSDHGDMLGDHGLLVKGAFFYEANVRVPLLIRPPRNQGVPSRRVEGLVQLHDLAATVLAAAGMDHDEIARLMPESQDLLPLCSATGQTGHEFAICCYRNSGLSSEPSRTPYFDPPIHATMIRDDRYKLSLFHEPYDHSGAGLAELYDVQNDPLEQHDLRHDPDYAKIKDTLLRKLLDWLASNETCPGSRGGEVLPTVKMQNAGKQAGITKR